MQAIIEQVLKNINDPHIAVNDVTPLHPMAGTNQHILTGSFDPGFFIAGERSIKLVKNIINALSKVEESHV